MINSLSIGGYFLPVDVARFFFDIVTRDDSLKERVNAAWRFSAVCKNWHGIVSKILLSPAYKGLNSHLLINKFPKQNFGYSPNNTKIKKAWFKAPSLTFPTSKSSLGKNFTETKPNFAVAVSNSTQIFYEAKTIKNQSTYYSLQSIDFFKKKEECHEAPYSLKEEKIVSIKVSSLSCVAFITEKSDTERVINLLYKKKLFEKVHVFNPKKQPLFFDVLGTTLFFSREKTLYYVNYFTTSKQTNSAASIFSMNFNSSIKFLRSVNETESLVVVTDKPVLYSFRHPSTLTPITDWNLDEGAAKRFKEKEIAYLEVIGPWLATVFKYTSRREDLDYIFFESPTYETFSYYLSDWNVFSFEKNQNVLLCDVSNVFIFFSFDENKGTPQIQEMPLISDPLGRNVCRKSFLLNDGRIAIFEKNRYNIASPKQIK